MPVRATFSFISGSDQSRGPAPAGESLSITVTISTRSRRASRSTRPSVYHWARVAVQHDATSKNKYAALRARGHTHGRALRSVADRLLAVACAMSPARRAARFASARLRSPRPAAKVCRSTTNAAARLRSPINSIRFAARRAPPSRKASTSPSAAARLRPARSAARCSVSYCADNLFTARTTSSGPPSTAVPTRSYSSLTLSTASRQADRARSSPYCPASPLAAPRPALPRSPAARPPRCPPPSARVFAGLR